MANLTLDEGVVRATRLLQAPAGHELLVYKRQKRSHCNAETRMALPAATSGTWERTSIPVPHRLAKGSGPNRVSEVVTHHLGLAIAELESGQTDPVRTALRLTGARRARERPRLWAIPRPTPGQRV